MVDDQHIWGNDQAVAPTPDASIVMIDLGDNFTVKDLLRSCYEHGLGRETIIQIFYHGLDEATQAILDAGEIFLYKTPNEAHQFLEDRVLLKLNWSKDIKAKPLRKTVSFVEDLETKFGRLTDQQSKIPTGTLPSNTQTNIKPSPSNDKHYRPPPAQKEHVNALFTWSGKTYDPPVNPNSKTTIIDDDSKDEADEAEKEVELSSSKKNKSDLPPLKVWHAQLREVLKRSHEQQSKMEQISDAFLNEECSAIVQNKLSPKVGNPGSFLIPCTLANSVEYLALANLGASINLMPYSLYVLLSENNLKPTRMSIRLANHTYQYLMGVAENMLVQVGKFVFLVDFVILQMEEDEKVPLSLERPFLHSADAIIRVKNKELNLGVRDDRITFLIDKAMQHSYSNDDTCFRMDVIDEVTEEELDALLNDSEPFLSTSEKINETSLDKEFEEFMAVDVEEIYEQEEEVDDNFEKLHLEEKLRIKTSIQDPPTNLEMKPLPKHLEYAFLEKDSLLPIVISALLKYDEKKLFVYVLKNYKEAFAWKTSDIPGINPSFCKHKINFEDNAKPILIKPADKEKTIITCPNGTYEYKRIPFVLCNAPATFQRCMVTIFQDMLETSMEVFMDDFLVFGDSFNSCLSNLEQMLILCKQAHLVLN
ncbi:reverse transcriptase domain-containing protein [Tanacetum coccineum]